MKSRDAIRRRIRTSSGLIFLLMIFLGEAGCGKGSSGSKAFESASPQIKTSWETAVTAAKSHDYATALAGFNLLATDTNLTAEQHQAIRETARAVSDEMYAAANKGDENAKKAIEDLRQMRAR